MARLMPIVVFAIGCCNVFGQNQGKHLTKIQEKKMLDSVLADYTNNIEGPQQRHSLHRDLKFLELPSNIDKASITFGEPIREYSISSDTSRIKRKDFKIADISVPLESWVVPIIYNGRYCNSLDIQSYHPSVEHDTLLEHPVIVNGDTLDKYRATVVYDSAIVYGIVGIGSSGMDADTWIAVDKRVAKDKRHQTRILYYDNYRYLHFPEIDDYNLLPLRTWDEIDTVSEMARKSPLKLNTNKVRDQLKEHIIESLLPPRPPGPGVYRRKP